MTSQILDNTFVLSVVNVTRCETVLRIKLNAMDTEEKKVEASREDDEKKPNAEEEKTKPDSLHNETPAERRVRMRSIILVNMAASILAIGFTIISPGMYPYMKQVRTVKFNAMNAVHVPYMDESNLFLILRNCHRDIHVDKNEEKN